MHDVVVVGAGHNGLICACYLARLGLKVCVVERRGVVGGAVCTEEIVPGYRFDVGSSVHIMFRSTPIMEELELARFGLAYVEMDPWAFYPIPGSDRSISFYRDVGRTCDSIAAVSPSDASAYKEFVKTWGELNEGVWDVFLKPPSFGAIVGTIAKRNLFRPQSRKVWSSMDITRALLGSYGHLIQSTFTSEEVRAALTWLAAQSGPPPEELGTGDLVGWQAMIHKHGAWRAKGGSGALTQALARALEASGGQVVLDAPVERITKNGESWEVQTPAGVYRGKAVVAACHVVTALRDLLDPKVAGEKLRRRVNTIQIGNGFGMTVRHAVSALPAYPGQPRNAQGIGPAHSAMQLLCPNREYLGAAYRDYAAGRPPEHPAVLAMTFSALDPTLAPPGKHVLFAWAQYHPYELRNGEQWDAIAEREADKIYDQVCRYAPNMRDALLDRFIQTPLAIEQRLGLLRANVMHVEMSINQMFSFRPLPELSQYRTPFDKFYLTGASTHPGGGVFGASGRNAAQVVAKDFGHRTLR
ncbi:MAG TPA: NAD(P)/FAD-dependent oxidoreductase [Chthoniobacterales bacterium]